MLDRLQSLADRYEKLSELLCDPDVASDSKKLRDYSKEQSDLQPAFEAYSEYKNVMEELEAAKMMQAEKLDDEMKEMVKMEIDELSERQAHLEEKIRLLLLPKDPNDDKNVIVETAAQPAETKRLCSPLTCTGCIPVMPIPRAGAWN